MSESNRIMREELEAALEDVRQVRSYVDKLRLSHPIRTVIQPLHRFALGLVPILVGYGVGMQLILDSPQRTILGISKTALIAGITTLFVVTSGIIKYLIYTRSSRDHGHDYGSLFRRMLLGDGYIRIAGSMMTILVVLSIVVIQLGQGQMIVSLIGLCSGAIWVMMPLAIPLPEYTRLGIGLLVASSISIFVFPAYPFYKAAVLFGSLCLVVGLTKFHEPSEETGEVSFYAPSSQTHNLHTEPLMTSEEERRS